MGSIGKTLLPWLVELFRLKFYIDPPNWLPYLSLSVSSKNLELEKDIAQLMVIFNLICLPLSVYILYYIHGEIRPWLLNAKLIQYA